MNTTTMTVAVSPPRTPRQRVTLTSLIVEETTKAERIEALLSGWRHGTRGDEYRRARAVAIGHRVRRGFAERGADFLTSPDANAKLSKGAVPSYGLTCQSHALTLSDGTEINACPWAGLCVSVCVLNRGHGRQSSVQSARDWRTDLLGLAPLDALVMIGAELRRGVRKHGAILFRPNVNSDLAWHTIVGDTLRQLPGVTSYGYSKRPLTAETIGPDWDALHGLDHIAYSASERTDNALAERHLALGGNVATVTDRAPKQAVQQWHAVAPVVDADLSDEWIVKAQGTIGDLSFKTDKPIDAAPRFVRRVGYASA